MTNPWKGRSTLKGKTTLKRDDQPLKWKINLWKGWSTHGLTDHVIPDPDNPSLRVSMGLTLGPFTHSCIVHKNYLHITTKGLIMQLDLLYMERWSCISWDPSLYKEIPMYRGIRVSFLPLYKSQTLPFLRYVNPP